MKEVFENKILKPDEIVDMYDKLGLSLAIIDEDFVMIYMNKEAERFYKKAFGAENLLGVDVRYCHELKHIKNIEKLMTQFKNNEKPFSFFGAEVPIFEGGHLRVLHFPYFKGDKFVGIMEIPIESSLQPGGRCEYNIG